jgi:hypothetical protein
MFQLHHCTHHQAVYKKCKKETVYIKSVDYHMYIGVYIYRYIYLLLM